jgi:hypothetical protein
MIDPKSGFAGKLKAMPQILGYYATWYPPLWLKGLGSPMRYGDWGSLAGHLRFIEKSCRRLARASFHGMALYQAKMERKQAFLFRCVDIVMELFAMAASLSHARALKDSGAAHAAQAIELADLFCRGSRRKVNRWFKDLWSNEDDLKNKVAGKVLRGELTWLEQGGMGVGLPSEAYRPKAISGR